MRINIKKATITLGVTETTVHERADSVGYAFRAQVRAFARELANRIHASGVVVYSSAAKGSYMIDQIMFDDARMGP